MLNFISIDQECYSFTDDDGRPYPALVTRGCGCCAAYRKVTRENLDEAIRQAEEWLAKLRETEPVDYPEEVSD
jgi:hypothetical protein